MGTRDEGDRLSIGGPAGGEAGISEAGRLGEERWCGAGPPLWPVLKGTCELPRAQAQGRRMAAAQRRLPHLSRPRMLRNNRDQLHPHPMCFTGLRNGALLSLHDNQIATISPGAFDTLQALSTLGAAA